MFHVMLLSLLGPISCILVGFFIDYLTDEVI